MTRLVGQTTPFVSERHGIALPCLFCFENGTNRQDTPINQNLKCGRMAAYNDGMDKVFKALADSSRRQLVDELFKKNG
jgi:hypothetical protein